MRTARQRQALRAAVAAAAQQRHGLVTRAELAALGVDDKFVAREIAAGRWRSHGRVTIATHTADLAPEAHPWRAVWEVGAGAVLDGVTALQAWGLSSFDEPLMHVSVQRDHSPKRVDGVRIHRVSGRTADQVVTVGQPRAKAEFAAIRAAQWAVSDRQAALILCMVVQQRLTTAARLLHAVDVVKARGRSAFVRRIVRDIARGAQSLGELDFASLCRARGLPEPSRQVVRDGLDGRTYLDVRWDGIGLVVEIDGAQHRQGLAVTKDNLRRNQRSIEGDVVITIDLVGLRLRQDDFLDQVVSAYWQLTERRAG